MQQTFKDMLEGEKTNFGRGLVWVRALLDLPISASKEHLNYGKEINMNRNTKFVIVGALIAVVIVGLASFWEGNLHARTNIGVERVTTAQLADAMQQDNFYSTYGNSAVLFSGKVIDINTKDNASIVSFNTGRPYSVVCQFPKQVTFKTNDIISIAAPAGSAERQVKSVLLHNCLEN